MLTAALLLTAAGVRAQPPAVPAAPPAVDFDACFENRTLRIDYLFTGDAAKQEIALQSLSSLPVWAGRRHRLAELPLFGNGQVTVTDTTGRRVLYRTSFSSLFSEWLATDEAQRVRRGYDHTVLLPWPKMPVRVEVCLFDARQRPRARLVHEVRPDDRLIRAKGTERPAPHRCLVQSGDPAHCIDVAIVAEGYTSKEAKQFYRAAEEACEAIFAHEPFRSCRDRFNVVAVAAPSEDSGVSVPAQGVWRETAVGSHFDTFYSERYLTAPCVAQLNDLLAALPYEHIIVLANTTTYGGGGIYNDYTLTAAGHAAFRPVVVHEFGHSFGGLADEYAYEQDDASVTPYPADIEPWEQNITTRVDFAAKWEDLLTRGAPVPTPLSVEVPVGLYEGGGGSFPRGVYRPARDCRMRSNRAAGFCPVCQRALQRLIDFYTAE